MAAADSSSMDYTGAVAEVYAKAFIMTKPVWEKFLAIVQERLPSGEGRLLDVAAGAGEPGVTIAEAMPGLQVVVTDLQQGMVEQARNRSEHLPNVEARVASAMDLSDFEDASFDFVTVNYGHPFVPDLPLALREAHRVLKPGGALITTYWKTSHILQASTAIYKAVTGSEDIGVDPLRIGEEGFVDGLLEAAGFTVAETRLENYRMRFAYPDDALSMMTMPVLNQLSEAYAKNPEARAQAKAALAAYIEEEQLRVDEQSVLHSEPNYYYLTIAEKPQASA